MKLSFEEQTELREGILNGFEEFKKAYTKIKQNKKNRLNIENENFIVEYMCNLINIRKELVNDIILNYKDFLFKDILYIISENKNKEHNTLYKKHINEKLEYYYHSDKDVLYNFLKKKESSKYYTKEMFNFFYEKKHHDVAIDIIINSNKTILKEIKAIFKSKKYDADFLDLLFNFFFMNHLINPTKKKNAINKFAILLENKNYNDLEISLFSIMMNKEHEKIDISEEYFSQYVDFISVNDRNKKILIINEKEVLNNMLILIEKFYTSEKYELFTNTVLNNLYLKKYKNDINIKLINNENKSLLKNINVDNSKKSIIKKI